jgi:Oxysterol-binding protein
MNIIKRVGSNIIQGKSVMSISLPIEIFESRSFLERMARSYGHAPIYLEKAAKVHNVVERLKIVTAFFMASFMMGIQQEKPFNPILGETFQGR